MRCFECDDNGKLHSHHVVPKSRGGTRTVLLCEKCHGKSHHRRNSMATSSLTKDALHRKRIAGERIGQIPFGFNLADDGKKLVPNADEQKVLEMIWQWRIEGKTMREIAGELTRQGIQTKKGKCKWHPTAVHRIVSKPKWSSSTVQYLLKTRLGVSK